MAGIASELNTFGRQVQSACEWMAAVRMQKRNERMSPKCVFTTRINIVGMIKKEIQTYCLSGPQLSGRTPFLGGFACNSYESKPYV